MAFLRLAIRKRSADSEPPENAELPAITLVVPTYNEEMIIGPMLENTLEQDYPPDRIEILVVDSASTDKTRDIVQNRFHDKRVNLVPVSVRGWNLAVRIACDQSKSEIIVLSGADVFYRPGAIRALCKHFASSQTGAVTGRQILLNQEQSFATQMEGAYRRWQRYLTETEALIDQPFDVKGELIAARKSIIRSIVDRVGDNASIDTCIPMETRAQGYRVVYEPAAMYSEKAPEKTMDRFHMQIRRARNLIQSALFYSWMAWKPRYGTFGTVIFPYHLAFLLVMPWFFTLSVGFLLILILLQPWCGIVLVPVLVACLKKNWRISLSSFLMGQTALAIGSLLCLRSPPEIKRIDSTREK
jgi:cellulose synthase/poly-beta-1,6-N-acetylglucosamine synthase-like glycosyltransferase